MSNDQETKPSIPYDNPGPGEESPRAVASRLWGGTPVIPPYRVEFARSVEAIQELIRQCREGSTKVGGNGDGVSVPMAVRSVPIFGEGQGNTFIGQGLVLEENVGATLNLTEYPGLEGDRQFQYDPSRESITCLSSAGILAANKYLRHEYGRQFPCLPVSTDLQYNILRIGGLLGTGSVGNWSVKEGPLAAHVLTLWVVTGTGEYRELSLSESAPAEDRELAQAVLGGYGGFAVIVKAEIATQAKSTPLPVPRGLAISAGMFMKDADQRAEESFESGYMTGLCFLWMKNTWIRRPVYLWVQSEKSITDTDGDNTQPVTVDSIDPGQEPHKGELHRLWTELQDAGEDLEQDIESDVQFESPSDFSTWLAKQINDAMERLGIVLESAATELESTTERAPPRACYNVWLNLFFNGPSNCQKFLRRFADIGIGTREQRELLLKQPEPLTYAPVWIIPMLRSAFANVPMIVLPPAPEPDAPDYGTRWVYFVGIYPGENDPDKADQLTSYMVDDIYPAAQKFGATIYQVGSVPVSGPEHYGESWPDVQALKEKYDPDNILANGYGLFDEPLDS